MKKTFVICMLMAFGLMLASCSKQKENMGAEKTEEPSASITEETSEPADSSTSLGADTMDDGANGGDFPLTGMKWEWVEWDGNGDGEKEQISFEYIDNGDEAESFVLVTLEDEERSQAYIDRARRIVRILAGEDAEGPLLQVEYNYMNQLTEEADSACVVRIRDGVITVEETEG